MSYTYLGIKLGDKLNLIDHHNATYKRLSGRTKLLKRIRHKIPAATASTIYKTMICPIMFYCNNISLNMPDHQAEKYQYIQDRAESIVNDRSITTSWKRIKTLRFHKSAVEVFKNLHDIGQALKTNFEVISHQYTTRRNGSNLRLPAIKTDAARKTFMFNDAKIYNQLPKNLVDGKSFVNFKNKIKSFSF